MASPREAAAPTIVLTRQTLLSLYSSPLVPQTLDGMKPLSEWYGEYTTPPSPPIQRSHLPRGNSSNQIQQSTTERGDRGDRDRGAGRRLAPFTSENPFANFGRFGVDGGLGEPLELPRRSRKGGELTGGGSGGGGEKDLAPHLQQLIGGGGGGKKGKDNEGGGTSPWSDGNTRDARERRENFFREERERSERSKNATAVRGGALAGNGNGRSEIEGDRRRGAAGLNGRETGDASERKDRRGLGPADEGGWRSVGTTREEREKRLLRNQSTSTGNALTDSPRRFDRGDRNDRDPHSRSSRDDRGDRRGGGGGGGGGGPAWMNDEESSSPSWMDAPAAGNLTFSKDGVAIPEGQGGDDDELEAPAKKSSNLDWTAGGNSGMMDSIQQWKQQMKEAERKERERDLRDAGIEPQPQPEPQPQEEESSSVFSALTSPKPEPASTKSIFEDLGIVRSPAVTPAAPPGLDIPRQQGQGGKGGEPGGRASRFAKFFDGKPQSPVTQAQQPPPSVFGALMGGNAQGNQNGNGPSKEDSDSMARLMGMLQVQGSRTGSPATHTPHVETASPIVASPASVAAPPPAPSAPASTTTAQLPAAAEESRSSSRFKFSNSTSKNSPSISSAPSGALSSQVSSAVQSPSAPSAPPTSSIPPPGFGGYSSSLPQPHQQPSHPHPQTSLNHLPPIMSPADQLRSPPLPLPQSQQQNLHHPRTISSTSDLASRSSTLGSNATSPPPPSQNYSMNNPQQQLHQNRPFPPQFYNNGPPLPPSNGQQRMPPPPGSIPGMNLPPLGMYPPGSQGLSPAHSQLPLPGQPHQGMMNPSDMLRNLPPPNPNGMRSPPPPSFPPPHGMGGMLPPHARGPQQPSQMMYPPPPTGPLPPHGYAPPHFQQQGGRPQGMQGMSLGGNAGVDLMALLNSGQGGMRIGGNQGPPPNHGPQQGNLPPFLMDGR